MQTLMLSRSLATQVDGAPHGNASAHSAMTDRKEIQREGSREISFRGGEGWSSRGVRLVWIKGSAWMGFVSPRLVLKLS